MVSFCRLLEHMDKHSIMEHEVSENALSVIKAGLNIDENFWDKFLQLLNNKDGLADLLNVSPDKIYKWHDNIKQAVRQVEQETGDVLQNKKLM